MPLVMRALVVTLLCSATSAWAGTAAERVAADARAGRPLVSHVYVALCDNKNQGIVPVPARLGNGQDPEGNLYWGARFGVRSYFQKAPGWRRLPYRGPRPAGVLERAVFASGSGSGRSFVVADAWDGARIRETITAFLEAAAGRGSETVRADTEDVAAGGTSHVVAFVGHDGLMDFDAPPLAPGQADPARAAIVLACASRPYFLDLIRRAKAEPLLTTTGLMAPEAYSLEAALETWFRTGDPSAVHAAAAKAYDAYQHCGIKGARRLFATDPR